MMATPDNDLIPTAQLQLLRQKIEVQLQWGTGENWRHQDFQTLSEKILEKTGEQLSTTTLKRIWGKLKYNSLPNTHTLNILARFADYENWLAFHTETSLNNGQVQAKPLKIKDKKPFRVPPAFLKIAGAFLLFSILIFGVISLVPEASPTPLSPTVLESVQFSSHPVTTGVPNTVIFKYDVSKVPSENIQIQQNWDNRRRFEIQKDQFEVASTYYYPGHWLAKLVVDDQVIQEQDIYIKSNGWVTTIDRNPIPRYLKTTELIQADYLGIAPKVQQELHNQAARPESLTYHYIEDFKDLHSDNFSLALAFKNTYTKGDAICQFTRITIDCTEGVFLIPFSIPGCVGDLSMRFSEVNQRGKDHDFSAFGCDFQEWQHFRILVQNRQVQLFLNEQKIHKIAYQKSAGKVAGMKIRFVGSGAIDKVHLRNGAGRTVYQTDF